MLQIIARMGGDRGINTALSQDLLLSDRSLPLIGVSEINRASCTMAPRTKNQRGKSNNGVPRLHIISSSLIINNEHLADHITAQIKK